ncbi:MAG TPA: chemotaxis protein CheB [Isosphaeraceae bacterium]|nr:chemotaxis protein CheB [Isosphaeraceae bacterium]
MAFKIVVIGTSLGGLSALKVLLGGLPESFPLPVAIVQHRVSDSTGLLRVALQTHCALPVGEPEDKELLAPARVYLAPPDYHLLVERGRFALSTEGRVCHARPSIDVLFETAAVAYGAGSVGVILTGQGRDGAGGAVRIKAAGGLVVVQDPETAESRSMPDAALATCAPDHVLSLPQIAPFLARLCPSAPG